MKYATLVASTGASEQCAARIQQAGGWWVRFGNAWFVYAADRRWATVIGQLADTGLRQADLPSGQVRKGDLHLVTQKGRAFQQAHPEVAVLFDAGRYLVVDCPLPGTCQGSLDSVCYRLDPLVENATVFEPALVPTPATSVESATSIAPSAELQQRLAARYRTWLDALVELPSRHSERPEYREAVERVSDGLSRAGWRVRTPMTRLPSGHEVASVVASRSHDDPINAVGDRTLLQVVAHLDSINHADGQAADAPGADDNASGAAAVLTMAEYLGERAARHDIEFVLFGAEEQGLLGSRDWVRGLSDADRQRLVAVINMDMIGSRNTPQAGVLIEAGAASEAVVQALLEAAEDLGELHVQVSRQPFGSDHVPYIEQGLPAVLTIEAADGANAAIHTAADTLQTIDLDLALAVVHMNLLAVVRMAGVDRQSDWPEAAANAGMVGWALHARQLEAQYQRLAAGDLLPQALLPARTALSAWVRQVCDTRPAPLGADNQGEARCDS